MDEFPFVRGLCSNTASGISIGGGGIDAAVIVQAVGLIFAWDTDTN